jgi:hypothetical protein
MDHDHDAYFVVYGKSPDDENIVEGPFWSRQKARAAMEAMRDSSAFPHRLAIRSATFTFKLN